MKEWQSERLALYPLTAVEWPSYIDRQTDAHLRAAYTEMFAGFSAHPATELFYTVWLIKRRSDGKEVGSLGFMGEPEDGVTELGYGIDEPFRGNGYATEAVGIALRWAFGEPGVTTVKAYTEPDNESSAAVLRHNGFSEKTGDAEVRLFLCEKNK